MKKRTELNAIQRALSEALGISKIGRTIKVSSRIFAWLLGPLHPIVRPSAEARQDRLVLNEEQSLDFVRTVTDPSEPSVALKAAAARYARRRPYDNGQSRDASL